jgi:hypothetical protein
MGPKAVREAHYIKLVSAGNHIRPDSPDTPDMPDIPDSKAYPL